MSTKTKKRTVRLVGIALFSAIVIVLQMLGAFIKLGGIFSVSLVLIPIVVGSAVYGRGAGAFLGFVFGVAVLLSGDAAAFIAVSPAGAVLTVLIKGIAAGAAVDFSYNWLSRFNKYLATVVSAILCPVINTGFFLIGCKLFFMDFISDLASQSQYGTDVIAYMILSLVGANFIFELIVNMVLSPVIVRVTDIGVSLRRRRG